VTVASGGTTYLNQTFASGAAAQSYFDDRAFDFGALASSGVLNLTVSLSVTSDDAGAGFHGDFIVGDPPAAPRPQTFAAAMASMGAPSSAAPATISDLGQPRLLALATPRV